MALNRRQFTREVKVQFHRYPSQTSLSSLPAEQFESVRELI
jgi:hypothetical protein